MKISPEGIALIKQFEGCRLNAYPDPATGGDPWTIGIGHTASCPEFPKPPPSLMTEPVIQDFSKYYESLKSKRAD